MMYFLKVFILYFKLISINCIQVPSLWGVHLLGWDFDSWTFGHFEKSQVHCALIRSITIVGVVVLNFEQCRIKRMSCCMTKPTKWPVHTGKTQISLGICPDWSESSVSAWRKLGFLATDWVHRENWSDWADAQADLSLRWAHSHFVGFVKRRLKCRGNDKQWWHWSGAV